MLLLWAFEKLFFIVSLVGGSNKKMYVNKSINVYLLKTFFFLQSLHCRALFLLAVVGTDLRVCPTIIPSDMNEYTHCNCIIYSVSDRQSVCPYVFMHHSPLAPGGRTRGSGAYS